jgi:hypothetical protein
MAATLCLIAAAPLPAYAPSGFDARRASFRVSVGDTEIPYNVFAVSVLPQELVSLRLHPPADPDSFHVICDPRVRRDTSGGGWAWRAPLKHGLSVLRIVDTAAGDTMTLNIFTLVPAASVKKGVLNGVRIGSYPSSAQAPKPPRGFIEVTLENALTQVSPHFTIGQFLAKKEGGFPRYMVLDADLLFHLEGLLQAVNRRGHAASTFAILSGYRTPHYNRQQGNVRRSQHLYGRAADIFIDDSPRDDVMDDLNGDGVSDRKDAVVLSAIVDSLEASGGTPGGMSTYPANGSHGPFIHVDVRGNRVRW